MKAISYSLTEPQFLDGSKDVTRRLGWLKLKAGYRLRAVRKAMGLKKGEKQHVLGEIEVVSVRREKLNRLTRTIGYGYSEVRREGFPDMTPGAFVEFFCKSHRGCTPDTLVTRIEFRRLNNVKGLPRSCQARLPAKAGIVTDMIVGSSAWLALLERWRTIARRAWRDASLEPDKIGKKVIEMKAMCCSNFVTELEALISYAIPASPTLSKYQMSMKRRG